MGIPGRFASCLARFGAALVVTTLVAMGSGAYAQDLEPKAYANAPVGLNFLIAGYAYSSGGVATGPALPVVVLDGTPCLLDWERVVKN